MAKTTDFPKCKICKLDMISDATSRKYCRLCSMIINNGKFCCNNCETKYKKFMK